jgi:hypothetical protein
MLPEFSAPPQHLRAEPRIPAATQVLDLVVFPGCCAEFTDRLAQIHATSIVEKTPSYGDLGPGLRFLPPLQKQLDGTEAPVEDGLVE